MDNNYAQIVHIDPVRHPHVNRIHQYEQRAWYQLYPERRDQFTTLTVEDLCVWKNWLANDFSVHWMKHIYQCKETDWHLPLLMESARAEIDELLSEV